MMIREALLAGLLLACNATQALATEADSQARQPGESAEQAYQRFLENRAREGRPVPRIARTAYNVSTPLAYLDVSKVPDWGTVETVQQRFAAIRDERFLALPEMAKFPRRVSWLFPDDGCFARATMSGRKLQEWGIERPAKLFIFGNLSVATPNAPAGRVGWWYHVVGAVRAADKIYVIDPAIDPRQALELTAWIRRMAKSDGGLTFAACDALAYAPDSLCYAPSPQEESSGPADQRRFLRKEWARLESLGRSPEKELGEHPPWNYN